MAATHSNKLPLGKQAPGFELIDTITGKTFDLQMLKGEAGTLILFICNHCPYVIHVKEQLIDIAEYYAGKGVSTIAISSNEIINYPQDAPDKMQQLMAEWSNPFAAYLFDETQNVAKSYHAACTPDIYLFDASLHCVYHGRLDESTPSNGIPPSGKDLREALENLITGNDINSNQQPSIGCNIKWKPKN